MTTRPDATYINLADRAILLQTAVDMIDEGLDMLYEEALEAGTDPDSEELHEMLHATKAEAYAGALHSLQTSTTDSKHLVRILRLDQEANKNY